MCKSWGQNHQPEHQMNLKGTFCAFQSYMWTLYWFCPGHYCISPCSFPGRFTPPLCDDWLATNLIFFTYPVWKLQTRKLGFVDIAFRVHPSNIPWFVLSPYSIMSRYFHGTVTMGCYHQSYHCRTLPCAGCQYCLMLSVLHAVMLLYKWGYVMHWFNKISKI